MWDVLWTHAGLATMEGDAPFGFIPDGALALQGERIAWCGPMRELPHDAEARAIFDVGGRCITPGLVDAHTHAIFGGNRVNEFALRLAGATYEEIAAAGGGILSTVAATRAAGEDALLGSALARVLRLRSEGVTTIEIKSGYGLDVETELRMLRVARGLGERARIGVQTTFLGAHTVPPEFRGRTDDYVDLLCSQMIPLVAQEGLADAVDAFCERIAFSEPQVARVFDAAAAAGLRVKLHADQLSDSGGAALAARYRALSADHLEHSSSAGLDALARAGTVAVLLPGAFYFLRETARPPVAALRARGVPLAVATDCNPGTSPLQSLLLAANMASTLFGLTPHESLAGITRNGARALGLLDDRGTLSPGKRADVVVWDVQQPEELVYAIAANPAQAIYKNGAVVDGATQR